MVREKKVETVCFPVPKNFMKTPAAPAPISQKVKEDIFRQTVQAAFRISVPYNFTSDYNPEKPHKIASEDQLALVAALFEGINPQDAVEMALAQQFIIIHIQALSEWRNIGDSEIKMIELTHQILECLQKYKTKGAQLIQVQYNHNQGQINNININENKNKHETIDV